MSSRNTLDTNILKIRDVFALNPATNDVIQQGQLLKIGEKGRFRWQSTSEFFSTMYVEDTSGSVLDILQSVQPGISSLSSALAVALVSTVDNLGSSGYVSTNKLNNLSGTPYNYISASCLFDVINNLGQINNIQTLGPMQQVNFEGIPRGYVSTTNLGEYKSYYSSLTTGGSNLNNIQFNNATNEKSVTMDLTGFISHWTGNNSSRLIIDVNLNETIKFEATTSGTTYISTILTLKDNLGGIVLGNPVLSEVPAKNSNDTIQLGSAKFLLIPEDFAYIYSNAPIELRHIISTPLNETVRLTTLVPRVGGVFVTLDNMDK